MGRWGLRMRHKLRGVKIEGCIMTEQGYFKLQRQKKDELTEEKNGQL